MHGAGTRRFTCAAAGPALRHLEGSLAGAVARTHVGARLEQRGGGGGVPVDHRPVQRGPLPAAGADVSTSHAFPWHLLALSTSRIGARRPVPGCWEKGEELNRALHVAGWSLMDRAVCENAVQKRQSRCSGR